jgi:hypothetical protein
VLHWIPLRWPCLRRERRFRDGRAYFSAAQLDGLSVDDHD